MFDAQHRADGGAQATAPQRLTAATKRLAEGDLPISASVPTVDDASQGAFDAIYKRFKRFVG